MDLADPISIGSRGADVPQSLRWAVDRSTRRPPDPGRAQGGGRYSDVEADRLAYYIDHGYVIMPRGDRSRLIDEYLEFFERAWDELPYNIMAISDGLTRPLSRDLYDRVAKVSCLHLYFERAGELVFPPAVLEFLTDIYERPPVPSRRCRCARAPRSRCTSTPGR